MEEEEEEEMRSYNWSNVRDATPKARPFYGILEKYWVHLM